MSVKSTNAPPRLMRIETDRLPRLLAARLREGGSGTVIGRASNPSGIKAFDYAATDLREAAKALRDKGIDITAALPAKDQIVADLRAAQPQRVDRWGGNGSELKLKCVQYDLRDEYGVMLIVCAGTGKQLGDDATQPWIGYLADVAKRTESAFVFAKELHRIGRAAWAAGTLLGWAEVSRCYIGSAERPFVVPSGMDGAQLFFELTHAQEQGRKFPIEGRRGMAARTDTEMVDGRATIGFGQSPPAGFGVARLRTEVGRSRAVLYLDGPGYRPDNSELASGWSTATDEDGNPADQVAAVQLVLATAYQPGWVRMDTVRELRRRGFSTTRLRSLRRRSDATIRDSKDSNAIGMVNTLLAHLDVYETGVLRIESELDSSAGTSFDAHDDQPTVVPAIEITGCFPEGGWATPEDFERIRRGLAGKPPPSQRKVRYAFAGLHVGFDGRDMVLRSRPRTYDVGVDNPIPTYLLVPVNSGESRAGFALPHEHVARMYAKGIAAAGEHAFILVNTADAATSPAIEALRANRRTVTEQRAETFDASQQLLDRIETTTGPASAALERRYNEEVHPKLEALDEQLADIDRRIDRERSSVNHTRSSAAASQVLELVAELSDPRSTLSRNALLPATQNVTYTRELATKIRGAKVFQHRLVGELVLEHGGYIATIPLEHEWTTGAGTSIAGRAPAVLEQLKAGVAFRDVDVALGKLTRADVADLVGTPSADLLFPRILDGRITAAVAHAIYLREGRTNAKIAAELNEPTEFIDRIVDVYTNPHPRWMRGNARYLTAAYASASCHDGVAQLHDITAWAGDKRAQLTVVARQADDNLELLYGVGYRIPPCAHCGSHQLAPMRIWEPSGPVCLDCRHDRIGLIWPADPYDTYLTDHGVWALARATYPRPTDT